MGADLGIVRNVASEPAPRAFEGEALVVLGHAGVRPLLLAALHHTLSPTGPYVELLTGRISNRGLRPALQRMPVAIGSRVGLPAQAAGEPATLKWFAEGRLREVHWEERGFRLRAEVSRTAVSGVLPARLLIGDAAPEDARVPGRLALARVEIEVPAGDPLAPLAGRRRGLMFSSAVLAGDTYRARLARRLAAVAGPS